MREGYDAHRARPRPGPPKLRGRLRGAAGLAFQAPRGHRHQGGPLGREAQRKSCDWRAQLRIADEYQPTIENELLAGHSRDQDRCDDRANRRPAYARRPKRIRDYPVLGNPRYDVPRPKTLYQRVICVNRDGCPLDPQHPQAYIVTENLRIEIVDEQARQRSRDRAGQPLHRRLGQRQPERSPTPRATTSGVKRRRAGGGGGAETGKSTPAVRLHPPDPLHQRPGRIEVENDRDRRGTQPLVVRAVDAADNAAAGRSR